MSVEKVLEHCPIGFMYDIYLPMNSQFETWLLRGKCTGQYITIPSRHFLKARRIYDKLPRDHWCYVCLMRKTFSQSFRRRLNKFWFDTDDTDQHFQRFFTISTSSFALLLENDENGHTSGHFGVWGLESLAFLTAQLAVGLARSEMLVCWRLVLRSRIHGIPIIHSHFTQMLVKGQCGLESFWCLAVTSYCEFIVHASQPRWEIPCEHFLILLLQRRAQSLPIRIQAVSILLSASAVCRSLGVCDHVLHIDHNVTILSKAETHISKQLREQHRYPQFDQVKRGTNAFASAIRHFAWEWHINLGMSLELTSIQWNFSWPCFEGLGFENGNSACDERDNIQDSSIRILIVINCPKLHPILYHVSQMIIQIGKPLMWRKKILQPSMMRNFKRFCCFLGSIFGSQYCGSDLEPGMMYFRN